jgi:hypothetical protein
MRPCLLRLEGEALVPLSAVGLAPEAMVRTYNRGEHPRLDAILATREPVRFAADSGPCPIPSTACWPASRVNWPMCMRAWAACSCTTTASWAH